LAQALKALAEQREKAAGGPRGNSGGAPPTGPPLFLSENENLV
jgi:hypothetical protein